MGEQELRVWTEGGWEKAGCSVSSLAAAWELLLCFSVQEKSLPQPLQSWAILLEGLLVGRGRFSSIIAYGSGELDQCKASSVLESFGTFSFLQCSLISPSSSTAGSTDEMC